MNRKKQKWITPIWSNPVGWSEKLAGSRIRVALFIVIHVVFISGGLFTIYCFLTLLDKSPVNIQTAGIWAILMGAGPIVFIGILYPAMYIYVIYRLLKIIEKNKIHNDGDFQDGIPPPEI